MLGLGLVIAFTVSFLTYSVKYFFPLAAFSTSLRIAELLVLHRKLLMHIIAFTYSFAKTPLSGNSIWGPAARDSATPIKTRL